MALDPGLPKISRSTYRWVVASIWLLAGNATAALVLLLDAPIEVAPIGPGAALILLHLIPAGFRFNTLGKPYGYAILLLYPLIGQVVYVWLLFADQQPNAASEQLTPTIAEQARGTRHTTPARVPPPTQDSQNDRKLQNGSEPQTTKCPTHEPIRAIEHLFQPENGHWEHSQQRDQAVPASTSPTAASKLPQQPQFPRHSGPGDAPTPPVEDPPPARSKASPRL